MKAAVFLATRNMYSDLGPPIKALLINSDVEKIYLLLEDDDPGVYLPPECEIINVSGQQFFPPSGPNFKNRWSWILLLRAAYHRIFPDLDLILSLDLDAFVLRDISPLWETPLHSKLIAAVQETTQLSRPGLPYYNAGVMLLNLALLRSSGRGDDLIETLNRRSWPFPEQDAINVVCSGSILPLPPEYNAGAGTRPWGEPVIRHFMGEQSTYRSEPIVRHFREMPWKDVRP